MQCTGTPLHFQKEAGTHELAPVTGRHQQVWWTRSQGAKGHMGLGEVLQLFVWAHLGSVVVEGAVGAVHAVPLLVVVTQHCGKTSALILGPAAQSMVMSRSPMHCTAVQVSWGSAGGALRGVQHTCIDHAEVCCTHLL
jgi:hypothetical protein